MPHTTLKLIAGFDQNETPVLNQAGVSSGNLIRYVLDKQQGGIIQKLGGWSRFYANTMAAKVRALWAWADTGANQHLASGTENIGITGQAQLSVITNGFFQDITPRSTADDIAVSVNTTSGSSTVKVNDSVTTGISNYDCVYIPAHISVGGLILFGLYATDPDGFSAGTQYTIYSIDTLGNPLAATATVTTGGSVAAFTTTNTSNNVNVFLTGHGYSVGATYPILISTAVGGVTLYGNYIVQVVVDANNFTIWANITATSTATISINSGNAHYIYGFGVGAIAGGSGYGIGGYGSGGYGSGPAVTPSLGTPIAAMNWSLDNWGGILISSPIAPAAVNPIPYQPIYMWDPLSGSPTATVISAAPPVNDGFYVAMPQRQIMAWGSTSNGIQDPLLVRWCDISNFNQWIPLVTNQAGSYRIPKGSRIVGGIQGPQQGYMWTDIALWSLQYIGQPYVWSFNEIATGCGLISRKAAATLGGAVYWMGPSSFFTLAANGVEPLPCTVWDVIFQNLDKTNVDKIRVAVNSRFSEISWFYPTTTSGGEVASYVKYNSQLMTWDFGNLARSAWIDQSVLGPPIGADPNLLYTYQHETSTDADMAAMQPYFQTGYFTMDDGDVMTFVDQMWPDMKWGYYNGTQNATVNITFYVKDYPSQTAQVFGPYSVTTATQFAEPSFRGRLVSILFSSNDIGSFWRIGGVRYRYAPDGKF